MEINISHYRQTTLLRVPIRSLSIDTNPCQGIILMMFAVVCTTPTLTLFKSDHVDLLDWRNYAGAHWAP